MKTLSNIFALLCFSFTAFAGTIEAHGNLLYYTKDKILHIQVVSGHVPEVGQAIKVDKSFKMGRLSGTHDLAIGTVIKSSNKDLQVKVSEYKSTLVEDGVKRPMCKAGDELIITWEGTEAELASANFDEQLLDAKVKFLKKNYKAALEDLDKLVQKDPHCLDCYFVRGRSYAELGQDEKALENYSKVVELHPKSARGIEKVYQFRAQIYFKNQQYEKALKDYDELLKLHLTTKETVYLLKKKVVVYTSEELSDDYDTATAKKHACDCVQKIIALEGSSPDNLDLKATHCD